MTETTLHELLDWHYGADAEQMLQRLLKEGADPDQRGGASEETALQVAVRRRRLKAVEILVDHGADLDARTAGGKTAYAHAVRRGFGEVADFLETRGATAELNVPDRLAVAIVNGRMDEAKRILDRYPDAARTGNPEEDRLLADIAGRDDPIFVELLISAGADLAARGLDDGTPLHQAAWFGQPDAARLLIDAGAPLDAFDRTHQSSPIHWAVHGSRYSGGAEERQDAYMAVVTMLLAAGSGLCYPDDADGDAYFERLLRDASPPVRRVLEKRPPSR